jgi:hypothetical protein
VKTKVLYKFNFLAIPALLVALLLTASCANNSKPFFDPEYSPGGDGRVNLAGPNQMFPVNFEQITEEELILMLDPEFFKDKEKRNKEKKDADKSNEKDNKKKPDAGLETTDADENNENDNNEKPDVGFETGDDIIALQSFLRNNSPDQKVMLRDNMQDYLLAASEQRCGLFKTYLRNVDTTIESWFGGLSLVFATAGALVPGIQASHIFSGVSGLTGAIGNQTKEAIFSELATYVIIPGIDATRKEVFDKIMGKRKNLKSDYTFFAAMNDVGRYHNGCSIVKGIEKARDKITENNEIDKAIKLMNKINKVGDISELKERSKEVEELRELLQQAQKKLQDSALPGATAK